MLANDAVRLPEVIVFAGPNGSGKSTITQMAKVGGEYINADDIKRTTLCTDLEAAVRKHSEMLYRICIVILGSEQDTQDAIQETFCKYLEKKPKFVDGEHEKAWLIKVAQNRCRDMRRFQMRHPQVAIDEITASYENPEYSQVLAELVALPLPVKAAVYLHYIEGYKTAEVSEILGISVNAVKKRLQRGRKLLRLRLEEE